VTSNRIDEIRARADAATPAPWGTEYDGNGNYHVHARLRTTRHEGMASDGVVASLHGEHGDGQTYANARFTAQAREDVPFLLDRVAELEAILIELWARVDDAGSLMSTSYVRGALGPRPANCRETRNYHPSRDSRAKTADEPMDISTHGWTA
jgi:hypothetical protein